jgi:hypothetical protein
VRIEAKLDEQELEQFSRVGGYGAEPAQRETRTDRADRGGGERRLADAGRPAQDHCRIEGRQRHFEIGGDELSSRPEEDGRILGDAALEQAFLETEVCLVHGSPAASGAGLKGCSVPGPRSGFLRPGHNLCKTTGGAHCSRREGWNGPRSVLLSR